MGPIEILWGTVMAFFVIIAIVRGYHKELGVTTVILATMWALKQAERVVEAGSQGQKAGIYWKAYSELHGQNPLKVAVLPIESKMVLMTIFTGAFLLAVIAAYGGRTLTFSGTPAKGHTRFLLNVSVGAINGYLVAGTLWYYTDHFGYPLPPWAFKNTLTDFARGAIHYLPPAIMSDKLIIGLVVLLILMQVRK